MISPRAPGPARTIAFAQVVGLLVLCAVGAELLTAYTATTGDPGRIAFEVLFFAGLYGAPALLARDLVRRRGWGWPSLLLLFAALGVTQAGLIDQSLFSTDYQGYEGWAESRAATLVPALGISAFDALNFVSGHVIFSFGAPIALAEAWVPRRARGPWLGRVGTVVAIGAYLGVAGLILSDPESHSGSPAQLAVTGAVVVALVGMAVVAGRRAKRPAIPRANGPVIHADRDRPTDASPRPLRARVAFAVGLVSAVVVAFCPSTWVGFVVAVPALVLLAGWLGWTARRRSVGLRPIAAVGLAFLLVRGGLAFTYFPLAGSVAPGPKYAHNVVMLLVVLGAGVLACRKGSSRRICRA